MPKPIDQFVSENRRATRRIDSTFVEVSTGRRKKIDFGVQLITVDTTIDVYTRDLNDSLISGHPEAKHGSGRGVSGDQRGAWSSQRDTESSEAFTVDGRNTVRDALDGTTNAGFDEIAVGDSTTTAEPSDTSLNSQTGRVHAWGIVGGSADISIAKSIFLFHEYGDSIAEAGVYSGSGDLFNHITFNTLNPTNEKEVRVDISFEVGGGGRGESVITDDGRQAVAEAIRNTTSQMGLVTMAFGDDDTTPTVGDSVLGNELFDVNVQRLLNAETVTTYAVVFNNVPASQPVDIKEIGVFDNNDNLVWRAVLQTINKDEDRELEVYVAFRAK